MALIQDDNADVRLEAIRAITYQQRGSGMILQALVERLHDTEEDVSAAAVEELYQLFRQPRNVTMIPYLIECLRIEKLAFTAAQLLDFFHTPETRAAVRAWRKQSGNKGS